MNDPVEVGRTRTINVANVLAPGGYLVENHGPAEILLRRSSLVAENHHFFSCCLSPSFPCCGFFCDQPLSCRVLGSRFDQLGQGIVFYEVFPLATRSIPLCCDQFGRQLFMTRRLITPRLVLLQSSSWLQGCLAAFGPTRPRFKLLFLTLTGNFVLRSHPLAHNVTYCTISTNSSVTGHSDPRREDFNDLSQVTTAIEEMDRNFRCLRHSFYCLLLTPQKFV